MNKLLLFFIIISTSVKAQNLGYKILEIVPENQSKVIVDVIVYCKKKKLIEKEAILASIKTVLFSGVGNGIFARPLMNDGEATSFQKFPEYMCDLYNYRYRDFIEYSIMESDYKKADKYKGTRFVVCVKASLLKKDLANNRITLKLGL